MKGSEKRMGIRMSVSEGKLFKACRRAWELKYCEGLIPVQKSDALQTGSSYHDRIEALEKGEPLECDYSKECAMAEAYAKYILPKFHVTAAEEWVEKNLGTHTIFGRLDGIADDGCVVEHKTTSSDITEGGEYEYGLLWDDQILAYMSMTGARKIHYTVCKKPTIRLKKGETEEEFYERMVAWYDEDTETKIRTFDILRSDAEVERFEREFEALCDEVEKCRNAYRNTAYCTCWGRRCEYSSVCLNYDPNAEYVEFTRGEAKRGRGKA